MRYLLLPLPLGVLPTQAKGTPFDHTFYNSFRKVKKDGLQHLKPIFYSIKGMDGQHQGHGETYAYSRPEWPEFYDLWVEILFGPGPAEDATVFQGTLRDLIAATPPGEKIIVLYLGMVLLALLKTYLMQ